MRILLTTLNAKYIHTNLAIRILYQLNKQHPGLEWKEFVIREPAESIAAQCMDYDVVAFSCYIWNITQTLAVTRVLKELNPEIKILLGGPEVSYEWEELMALEEIDFIICGEGETAFADFLQHYPEVDAVGALVQKKNGVVQYNPLRRAFDLKELEEIMPYAGDDTETLKDRVLYIETSRGCPYHCEFCLASLDNKVRYLPDRQIRNNLLYLMQHGRVIKFLDRTFNIKKDFTLSLFDFILLHYWNENVFQFEITADIVHPAIVQFVQERVPNGLFRFEIGIQTVNQEANLAVSRKQDFGKTSSVIRQLQHKIEMHLDLIVGLPFDYLPDIKYSIDSVFSLYPPELQLGFLKFLKGTPMREKELTHGYVYDPMPPYQIIRSNYLSEAELEEITDVENALEIYWNRKRALHTLKYASMKYSVYDFLLGLARVFKQRHAYHRHSFRDVFTVLQDFVCSAYPNDPILLELAAVDYHIYPKICPQNIFQLAYRRDPGFEVEQTGKFRYVCIPISFRWENWKTEQQIVAYHDTLWMVYNGRDAARIIRASVDETV